MITGVCGTVGAELLRQLLKTSPARIIGIDNNETELFFLNEEYGHRDSVHFFLCDLRDRDGLAAKMAGIDIVLHTAALKHVLLCEHSPRDAVQTNIFGTQNVIDAAQAAKVSRVLFTSSDKAVNPTNVMGTSKLMCERLITAANAHRRRGDPIFASTRFGNVLGSRGSVIPLFRQQIAAGGPVTLTDPKMTRFIMTLQESTALVMESVDLARGGEVFVTKMPTVRIEDLARIMIDRLAGHYGYDSLSIELRTIGVKSGEKMYEELMNDEETRRTMDMPRFFVVLPAFKSLYEQIDYDYPDLISNGVERPYNSSLENALSRVELEKYLDSNELLKA
jgi:FlaA1/EpsC-like NDP-sugar epimerase